MRTETLSFETPNGATTAFVALPEGAEIKDAAGVILIHEWWGITDHILDIAGRYASEGYVCIAPDLFRGKTASNPQEASKLMHELALDDGISTINQALDESRARLGVSRFAVTGYCMGGTFALRAACLNDSFSAAAPFYGDIAEDEVLARLTVPVLFISGERDGWITPEKVEGLKDAARRHGLPVEVVSYDADHAFFNDRRPEVYDPEAAGDAWRRVLAFFRESLRK